MTNQTVPKVTVTNYPGGQNAVITHGEKAVSVCKTDYGLFDVQANNGKYLYTGNEADKAIEATRRFLENES